MANILCENCKKLQLRCNDYKKVLEFIIEEHPAKNIHDEIDNYLNAIVEARIILEKYQNNIRNI